MSAVNAAAAAAPEATDAVPVKSGKKKKLILIAAGLAVLMAIGGGTAVVVLKKRAAAAAESEDGVPSVAAEPRPPRAELKKAPTFTPLDPFTVNLADREAERYAQIGITFELTDAKAADLIKAYMPAIRNNILLALSSKTAGQLSERDGKLNLAAEIRREALRPLGYDIRAPAAGAAAGGDEEDAPIRAVHFSNFIIQ